MSEDHHWPQGETNESTRLNSKISYTSTGCWEFTGYRDRDGYGRIQWRGKHAYLAHRAAYEIAYGSIPPGMTVDHLCNNRSCIRYEHLEAVSHEEDVRRAVERRTHCGNGHPWVEENTYRWDGRRQCRKCNAAAARRYQARLRADSPSG